MRKEWMWLGTILATLTLSESAFSRPVRREAGNLTKWNCSRKGCRKNFWEGWLIDINHKTPTWEGGSDTIDNAEPLCLEHHYRFHKTRGNGEDTAAARLIYGRIQSTGGGRTIKWREKNKK